MKPKSLRRVLSLPACYDWHFWEEVLFKRNGMNHHQHYRYHTNPVLRRMFPNLARAGYFTDKE